MLQVISLGGSILAPEGVNTPQIAELLRLFHQYLRKDRGRKLIIVVGGGGPARRYQEAYRNLVSAANPSNEAQDWIGIMATRLNAELLRSLCGEFCKDPVLTNPEADIAFRGQMLIGAGWKPGFSTDFVSVKLAERFQAQKLINISNIEKIYSADPKIDSNARPLDRLSWTEYQDMVGDEWKPGRNLPFDPLASKRSAELGMEVIFVGGDNVENIARSLKGEKFFGTIVSVTEPIKKL